MRAASDFGVPVEVYKQALFSALFGIQPGQPIRITQQQPAQAALPQGEYTTIGQRAFSNNQKRIKSALDQFSAGEMSQVMAEQTLASIGLAPDRIAALIADANDGGVEDATVQEVAV